MAFSQILVEEDLQNDPHTNTVLKKLNAPDKVQLIHRYEDYFGTYKKPYLHKRTNLNLILAKKRGKLVKPAPPAYGMAGAPHYYFVHAYNCIYECEYCYLQGYFNSPDMVLFTNYDEIGEEIENTIALHSDSEVWFHAGEFSDSLAMSNITGECEFYHGIFKKHPAALLELRTKSANIRALKSLPPLPNLIVSFSLSPDKQIRQFDRKTASLKQRLQAIGELHQLGHPVALHFDPIIWSKNYLQDYRELIQMIREVVPASHIKYVSLGVVRFPKPIFKELKRNYPDSGLHSLPLVNTDSNLMRYGKPLRSKILNEIKAELLKNSFTDSQIYLCME